MHWTSQPLAIGVFGALTVVGAAGRTPADDQAQTPAAARAESQLAVSVETFCSETKLRTTNARIRWTLPRAAMQANALPSLANATQVLDATVYKGGFEKGLLVTLPIAPATPDRPVAPLAQARQPVPRAFQIRLIEIEQPRAAATADAPAEMTVVVENLEPGVNYTWRVGITTTAGRIVSPPATGQARICPADMVPNPAVPPRRRG